MTLSAWLKWYTLFCFHTRKNHRFWKLATFLAGPPWYEQLINHNYEWNRFSWSANWMCSKGPTKQTCFISVCLLKTGIQNCFQLIQKICPICLFYKWRSAKFKCFCRVEGRPNKWTEKLFLHDKLYIFLMINGNFSPANIRCYFTQFNNN